MLSAAQLTGRDDSHLLVLDGGHRMAPAAARAFARLQRKAAAAGFELTIASAHRSFERQLAIWNGKASGVRPVYADDGRPVEVQRLSPRERLWAIMRYSAVPGTSRHHWGSDIDVYDTAAVAADFELQLSPQEVCPGGPFCALHDWLDECMAAGESEGFYRPYNEDRGGVAPERWHLSYAPMARDCEARLNESVLRDAWNACVEPLQLRAELEESLADWWPRYVRVPAGWCPEGE